MLESCVFCTIFVIRMFMCVKKWCIYDMFAGYMKYKSKPFMSYDHIFLKIFFVYKRAVVISVSI